ncbi:MAG: methyl-accepting chemotaxis protein [Oscillospiraceae bacterium]|nr:methyl-accepting chemotaxis protein [Oscillospiraceae bacterium]
MKIKSLGLKVSLIVALMFAVIITIIIYFVTVRSLYLVEKLAANEAAASNVTLAKELQRLENEALTQAEIIGLSHSVVNAVMNDDENALKTALFELKENLDLITVCDTHGNVIGRVHSDLKHDDVLNQKALSTALSTGHGISTIEKGTVVGLSTRGSSAIRDFSGNIIGAVTCGHDLSDPKYVDLVKDFCNSEVTIFDEDTRLMTTIIDDKGNRVVGTKASDEVIERVIHQRESYSLQIPLFGSEYFAYYSPLIVDNTVAGMLFTGVPIDEAMSVRQEMLNSVLMAGIICGVVCILLIFFFNLFTVNRPLKKIGAFARMIREGDIGVESSTIARIDVRSSDEVGILARELEQAYVQLQGYVREIKERMQGLVNGDLATESTFDFHGDFVLIKQSINEHVHNLNRIMTEISASSSEVSHGAKQIADGAQTLAQGSTEQAASIEELSSSIAEIAVKTKNNAEIAGKTATLEDSIIVNVEKGSRQMEEMVSAVREINQASHSIIKIIKVIDDIAFQTNILALNAAVEAARAGQHGKGFAVVAEEVRNLASKSAEAAKETGVMIEDSMEKAELGARIAEETAASLTEIINGINESSEFIKEISKASEEQSLGIEHINIGIDQVAQVVQQNSATAQEEAAASEEMNSQSSILQKLVSRFTLNSRDSRRALPSAGNATAGAPRSPDKTDHEFREPSEFGKY